MSAIDTKMDEVREKLAGHNNTADALKAELHALKKERWPTKCCRCWPNMISVVGFCSCCDFDHAKGERVITCHDPEPE